jgi:hypothetical protein
MPQLHFRQGAYETEWQDACRRETAFGHLIEALPGSHARADVVGKDLGIRRSLIIANGLRFSCKKEIKSTI